MSPGPQLVELDLDRKEELIIAKQLRACRVNILPRSSRDSSLSKSPTPFSPSSSSAIPFSPTYRSEEHYWPENRFRKDSFQVLEPDPPNLDHLKILDPDNPPWTQGSRDVSPAVPRTPTNGAVTKFSREDEYCLSSSKPTTAIGRVPDIRQKVRQSPSINVSDYDGDTLVGVTGSGKSHRGGDPGQGVRGSPELSPTSSINGVGGPTLLRPLPFLNDIKALRSATPKATESSTINRPVAGNKPDVAGNTEGGLIQPKALRTGYTVAVLPFLTDIKSLGMQQEEVGVVKEDNSIRSSATSPEQQQNINNGRMTSHGGEEQQDYQPQSCEIPKSYLNQHQVGRYPNQEQNDTLIIQQQQKLNVSQPPVSPSQVPNGSEVGTPTVLPPTSCNGVMTTRSLKGLASRRSSSPKTVQFNLPETRRLSSGDLPSPRVETDSEPAKPPKGKKPGGRYSLKITEKSNMSSLAATIIPQLNEMQKNFLGLLFFNELSQTIVDEMVAQQVSMMSGSKLAETLSFTNTEACDTAVSVLLGRAEPGTRASLVVDSLSAMDPREMAETVLNIAGYHQSIETVQHLSALAGMNFKMKLVQSLLQDENPTLFLNKIFPGIVGTNSNQHTRHNGESVEGGSDDHEEFNSCGDDLDDEREVDEEEKYEYFDFDGHKS